MSAVPFGTAMPDACDFRKHMYARVTGLELASQTNPLPVWQIGEPLTRR